MYLKLPIERLWDGIVTVKLVGLVAVPSGVVTVIGPVVAVAGTVAVIVVLGVVVLGVYVAVTPLNLTEFTPRKLFPVITTLVVLTAPLVGLNDEMVGAPVITVNTVGLVAIETVLVTVIDPVNAPIGTVAVIDPVDVTLNVDAETPPNFTLVVPQKFVPEM